MMDASSSSFIAAAGEQSKKRTSTTRKKKKNNDNNKTVEKKAASTITSGSSEEPRPNDVLCARGSKAFNHHGNRHLRATLQQHGDEYCKAGNNKLEKSLIVSKIIEDIHSRGGRFLRKYEATDTDDNNSNNAKSQSKHGAGDCWYVASEHAAREKVGQGFRDLLDAKYKSSTKAKRRQRDRHRQVHVSNLHLQQQQQPGDDATTASSGSEVVVQRQQQRVTLSQRQCSDDFMLCCSSSYSARDLQLERMFQQANIELLRNLKQQHEYEEKKQQQQSPTAAAAVAVASAVVKEDEDPSLLETNLSRQQSLFAQHNATMESICQPFMDSFDAA